MIPINLLLEHFFALGLLWGWALVAGLPLIALLRVPLGLTAAVPLGISFWTIALYLFCFPYGLICAAALAVCGATAVVCFRSLHDAALYSLRTPGYGRVYVRHCGASHRRTRPIAV